MILMDPFRPKYSPRYDSSGGSVQQLQPAACSWVYHGLGQDAVLLSSHSSTYLLSWLSSHCCSDRDWAAPSTLAQKYFVFLDFQPSSRATSSITPISWSSFEDITLSQIDETVKQLTDLSTGLTRLLSIEFHKPTLCSVSQNHSTDLGYMGYYTTHLVIMHTLSLRCLSMRKYSFNRVNGPQTLLLCIEYSS